MSEIAYHKVTLVASGGDKMTIVGQIPPENLPSYVDDVLEFANLAGLPASGETGKIYVALDTNRTYRWSGSAYIEVSSRPASTNEVPEGTSNLYFTDARAQVAVQPALDAKASKRIYQTANFTAVAYGRYHTSGTITVSDPASATAGDIYDVVVASGTAIIGGVTYAVSRFPIEREYSGSAWATIQPIGASKTTPVDADAALLVDSAAGGVLKSFTWANFKAALKSYFDTIYLGFGGGTLTGAVRINGSAASAVQLIVRAASGQTASINEVQDASGNVLTKTDAVGNVTLNGTANRLPNQTANTTDSVMTRILVDSELVIEGSYIQRYTPYFVTSVRLTSGNGGVVTIRESSNDIGTGTTLGGWGLCRISGDFATNGASTGAGVDWSKKMGFTVNLSTFGSDYTNNTYVQYGRAATRSSPGIFAADDKGIGILFPAANTVQLVVADGTAVTTSSAITTSALITPHFYMVYSDGTGNVSLYTCLMGGRPTLLAAITGGPTTNSSPQNSLFEVGAINNSGTAATSSTGLRYFGASQFIGITPKL